MAFRTNSYQQLSFNDSFGGLTSREQKALERSWAKVFAEDIFPAINEEPSNPSYPITKRAIYYAARDLSAQLGAEPLENTLFEYLEGVFTTDFDTINKYDVGVKSTSNIKIYVP